MSLDSSIISLAVKREAYLTQLQQAGVTDSDFIEDWGKVWRFVCRIHRDHGTTPSPEMVMRRYDWADLGPVRSRDLPVLLSDLRKRRTRNEFIDALTEAVDDADDYDRVSDAIQNLQARLNSISNHNGKVVLKDLFSREVTDDIVAEIRRRRSGINPGLPTGLTKFDSITGGMQRQRMIVLMGRTGTGKAQPLDARILTPTGWRTMGDMKVGSRVSCPDGSTARVVQVHPQGYRDIYRVVFSDGATTETTADHLWLTQTRNERRRGSQSVKTTKEIAGTLRHGNYWNHYVPLISPVDGPAAQLPIDPYVVGVLLGDGHIRQRGETVEVLLSTADKSLLREVNSLIEGNFVWMPGKYTYRFCDDSTRWNKTTTFRDSLISLGLPNLHSYDKVIPAVYMTGNAKQRLALLQGLLDTDGEVSGRTSAIYCSTSKIMATQVRELVWSLGGVATWNERVTHYTYRDEKHDGRPSYRVCITLPEGVPYFRLERKQSQIVACGQKLGRAVRTIRSVDLVRRTQAQCISINHPSQLYVTDNFIITHNSWIDLLFVAHAVMNGGKFILYPLEMTLYETAFRLYTIFTQAVFGAEHVLKNFDLSMGHVTPKKLVRFLHALEDKFAGQLLVADVGSLADPYTAERIEADCQMHKPDGYWVDYITLMKVSREMRERDDVMIRHLSHSIKVVAQRQDVIGGCSAQVNRDALKQNVLIPRPEHISFGDSIAHDADQVVSINRRGQYLFYGLVKNRHGPEFGRTRVKFFPNDGVIIEDAESEDNEE